MKPNPALQELQEKICKKLAPLKEGQHLVEYLAPLGCKFTRKEMKLSEIYGYPYVGKYWQPHITIAFFDDQNFEKFGKTLLKQSLKFKFTLNEITLFFFDKTNCHPCNTYQLMR